ncbi:MAG: CPBP family intramembrane glutamic endopeptidase [Bacteroidota bacterium]|nr:CPBP family intramembrane glutamic endopeptidase [Bacteroidota bacterium]
MPKRALLAGLRPAEKFLFSVVILFILLLVFQFLAAFLAAWIYGFSVSDILALGTYEDPKYVAASKLIQMLGSVGTFIVPALLFSYLFEGDLFSFYKFRNPTGMTPMLLVILMMVSVIPFINYMAEINMKMEIPIRALDQLLRTLETTAEEMMVAFTATKSFWGLLVNLLMIGVIAAVGEELIFRGLLQSLLSDMIKNIHVAILITALFFSAFHFQFFSFLPRFVLGLILGYMMYYGQSIWYPILAHFVNNAMGVIYYYFNSRGSADDMLEEIGTSTLIPVAAVVSLALFLLFAVLWYYQVGRFTSRPPQSGEIEKG